MNQQQQNRFRSLLRQYAHAYGEARNPAIQLGASGENCKNSPNGQERLYWLREQRAALHRLENFVDTVNFKL